MQWFSFELEVKPAILPSSEPTALKGGLILIVKEETVAVIQRRRGGVSIPRRFPGTSLRTDRSNDNVYERLDSIHIGLPMT